MNLPFETHTAYITLNGNLLYRLNNDYSKTKVFNNSYNFNEPYLLLDKHQFHSLKGYNYVAIKSDTPSEQRKYTKNNMGIVSPDECLTMRFRN
ncbi:hypothetical protein bcgnr5372_38670 [Bacillus luti]